MKRSRFTEEQIIGILREREAGMKVVEICRQSDLHTTDEAATLIGRDVRLIPVHWLATAMSGPARLGVVADARRGD